MKRQKFQSLNTHFGWLRMPFACAAILASSLTSPSYASSFLLAPTRIFFEGSGRSQELTIMNQSDKVQTYRLRLEDRRLKDSGEYEVISDAADPTIASPMLRLSVRQIVIPARSSGTVRVLLRKPAGQGAGEVRSHLIVTELPVVGAPIMASETSSDITVSITTIFGISVPVLVRTGELVARVTSVDIKRITTPGIPDIENVNVTMAATGNRSIFVDVRLVSTRQRRSAPIAVAKSFALYAPLSPRTVTLSLNAEQTALLRAGNVVLQYQEVNRDGTLVGAVSEVAF